MIDGRIGDDASENEELLKAVVEHKSLYFPAATARYDTAVRGTLRLCPPEERVRELAADLGDMREMFFGAPPVMEDVLSTLKAWERWFNEG